MLRSCAALLLGAGLASVPVLATAAPAAAAGGALRAGALRATTPGTPGTPQAPTTVFSENFQNRQGTSPVRLTQYTGATGQTYTADQAWLQNCNGWVAMFNDPPASSSAVAPQVRDCTPAAGGPGSTGAIAWNNVRKLAQAIGVINGSADPNTNLAVSAYTNGPVSNGDPGANKVEFATVQPIAIPAGSRFLTASVTAAATSCTAGHADPQLAFYLNNGTDLPLFTSPIDPCSGGTQVLTGFFAGRYLADSPILFNGTSAGIKMINQQGSGNGNDHAFDDITLLDVTPQMDKDFAPGVVQVGATSTLTFTITNTSDLLPKNGWSFTDSLPNGLVLANPADASTNCAAGQVTAADGGTTVTVTGNLNAGQASCTATVKVTSATAGTYTNNASDITDSTGINPPGTSSVTFTNTPAIDLVKSVDPPVFSAANQTLKYSFLVSNPSTVAMSGVSVTDNDLPGLSPIVCPSDTLAPGASQICTATYVTTAADLAAGVIPNTATATGTPDGSTTPVVSGPSSAEVHAVGTQSISMEKSAFPPTYDAAGEKIFYSFLVTNTSPVQLSDVSVADVDLPGLSEIHCPGSILAPSASQICTATYKVTGADLDRGHIDNTATAQGTPPDSSTPVFSDPSPASVTAVQHAVITVVKQAVPDTVHRVGQVIQYRFVVRNTGNVTLTDVHVTDTDLPGLSAIQCPQSTLAAGASQTCTATYRVTAADLHKGTITNTAIARGTPPGTPEPEKSRPSTATAKAKAIKRRKHHPFMPVSG